MYKDPLDDMFGDEHDMEGLSQLLLFHLLSGTTNLSYIIYKSSICVLSIDTKPTLLFLLFVFDLLPNQVTKCLPTADSCPGRTLWRTVSCDMSMPTITQSGKLVSHVIKISLQFFSSHHGMTPCAI